MINVAGVLEVKQFKDISREPKVRKKTDHREKTHTIALVPPNYVSTLLPDVEGQLSKAVARSKGRWTIPSLYEAIVGGHQHLWVAFNSEKEICFLCSVTYSSFFFFGWRLLVVFLTDSL